MMMLVIIANISSTTVIMKVKEYQSQTHYFHRTELLVNLRFDEDITLEYLLLITTFKPTISHSGLL